MSIESFLRSTFRPQHEIPVKFEMLTTFRFKIPADVLSVFIGHEMATYMAYFGSEQLKKPLA